MAHIEDGPPPTSVPTMMYPRFFPNSEIGVSRRIAIEHQSLAGKYQQKCSITSESVFMMV